MSLINTMRPASLPIPYTPRILRYVMSYHASVQPLFIPHATHHPLSCHDTSHSINTTHPPLRHATSHSIHTTHPQLHHTPSDFIRHASSVKSSLPIPWTPRILRYVTPPHSIHVTNPPFCYVRSSALLRLPIPCTSRSLRHIPFHTRHASLVLICHFPSTHVTHPPLCCVNPPLCYVTSHSHSTHVTNPPVLLRPFLRSVTSSPIHTRHAASVTSHSIDDTNHSF